MTSGADTGSLNLRSFQTTRPPTDVCILNLWMLSLGIDHQVDLIHFLLEGGTEAF